MSVVIHKQKPLVVRGLLHVEVFAFPVGGGGPGGVSSQGNTRHGDVDTVLCDSAPGERGSHEGVVADARIDALGFFLVQDDDDAVAFVAQDEAVEGVLDVFADSVGTTVVTAPVLVADVPGVEGCEALGVAQPLTVGVELDARGCRGVGV